MERIKTTVGVYAGILRWSDGKLLLRKRTEIPSDIPGKSFRGNWELPGGGVEEAETVPYHHLAVELLREIEEEVGIPIQLGIPHASSISPMPPMHAVLFKGPGGYDLAMVTPIVTSLEPTKGETVWVSIMELEQLAKEFEPADKKTGKDGKGLLGGYGKRMHCMALKALCSSPRAFFRTEAERMLLAIQKPWLKLP
jgi:8-oxo-dGTP pyrophosphatase MutT (NUDIX family)